MLLHVALPGSDPEASVFGIRQKYWAKLRVPSRIAKGFLLLLLCLVAALLARIGTPAARVGAALLVLLSLAAVLLAAFRQRKKWADPQHILRQVVGRVDPELAGRAGRALTLLRRAQSDQSGSASTELAQLHAARVLSAVSSETVRRTAEKAGTTRVLFGVALGGLCVLILFARALALVEGVDVLFARRGVGPFPISYVSEISVTTTWPAYLDGSGRRRTAERKMTVVPQGTEVEVRVVPRTSNRKLLLSDGVSHVPFLSDGQGGMIAHWTAQQPSELKVGARFGEVMLYDGLSTHLAPLSDRPPHVALAGAPSERPLDSFESLALKYLVQDDHGISQVDLVIETGQRRERLELVQLGGQERVFRGAHTLNHDHPLLQKAFLPVRVFVEAVDTNTEAGPSWGRSQAHVLTPAPLGQGVAARHRALRAFRRKLSGFVAAHRNASRQSSGLAEQARKSAHEQLKASVSELERALLAADRLPESSFSFLRAQVQALERVGAERAKPEAVLLAIDALLQKMGQRDAVRGAKDLGAAVEELAVQCRQLRFGDASVRLRGVTDLLQGLQRGAEQLQGVGVLGDDLGSVAAAELKRVRRLIEKKAYGEAEAAALHLAERLKRATPSFSSSGAGGVESGMPSTGQGGPPAPGGEGQSASEAPDAFEDLARQLEGLAEDGARALSELQRLIEEAEQALAEDFELSPGLEESRQDLLDTLSRLPRSGSGPENPRSPAAAGRGLGEAMADALAAGQLLEAIERGVDAEEALRRASELSEKRPGWLDEQDLQDAKDAVRKALREARASKASLERSQPASSSDEQTEQALAERELARRARLLADKSRDPLAPLPDENAQALRQASRLLEQAASRLQAGEKEAALRYADEAQTQLERAQPPSDERGMASVPRSGEGHSTDARPGHVPGEEKDRALEFRRRVEKGLGQGSGRLAPAVRRYAEELK